MSVTNLQKLSMNPLRAGLDVHAENVDIPGDAQADLPSGVVAAEGDHVVRRDDCGEGAVALSQLEERTPAFALGETAAHADALGFGAQAAFLHGADEAAVTGEAGRERERTR